MNDYLMHYGVMGMKWGVRRYQNADGSYTAEGRSHYGVKGERKRPTKAEKKLSKVNTYKTRLEEKAGRKSAFSNDEARRNQEAANDLARNKHESVYYREHLRNIAESKVEREAERLAFQFGVSVDEVYKLHGSEEAWINSEVGKEAVRQWATGEQSAEVKKLFDMHTAEATAWKENGAKWARRQQNLMAMPINESTSKKDVRKTFRGRTS